jgi:hypothetical protein
MFYLRILTKSTPVARYTISLTWITYVDQKKYFRSILQIYIIQQF